MKGSEKDKPSKSDGREIVEIPQVEDQRQSGGDDCAGTDREKGGGRTRDALSGKTNENLIEPERKGRREGQRDPYDQTTSPGNPSC